MWPWSCTQRRTTENAVMADSGRALQMLNQLHELGVRLSIDDFGMEYSSLGRLKDLPVHELKIDRSFVSAVRARGKELAIARSIIELGHSLGLEVVAEGVEDQETWTELELLGCDILQGFYIAKPMPADNMLGWLATWPRPRGLAAVGTGDSQRARTPMLNGAGHGSVFFPERVSWAYRKMHTPVQRSSVFSGGMNHSAPSSAPGLSTGKGP
ncbi:EAL domain-containing protein [Dactylosporangium sp. NPDC051485]|uniref:EAL domain-containing protein n=1 Tax=Dactylosporangium sp. NPDC051485 TaxID=3154846 RepID=UPI0034486093